MTGAGSSPGPGAILIHGFGSAPSYWDSLRRYLPPGLAVSAPTLPGHADRAGDEGLFSIESAASEIARMPWTASTILIGHSMGSRVAVEAALHAAHQPAAMVLIDGSCVPMDPQAACDQIAADLATRGRTAVANDMIAASFTHRLSDVAKAVLADDMCRLSDAAFVEYTRSMAQWDNTCANARIQEVTCPTLILQSTSYPKTARARREEIAQDTCSHWFDAWSALPAAQTRIMNDAGHYLAMEQPKKVAAAIDAFLKNLSGVTPCKGI